MAIDVSVVVPTRGRVDSLLRTLRSLAAQTLPPERYEVVVVADGDGDGDGGDGLALARRLGLPCRLVLEQQAHAGAAAARNFGARLATGPLLVFLDDDMEALPGLLEAHLAAQGGQAAATLGHFTVPLQARGEGPLVVANALWWDRHFSALFSDAHRMTFMDLLSGNLGLPKAVFEQVGAFDESFVDRAGEDYELGLRLMAHRVPFRYAPAASALHHDYPSLSRYCRRAFAEGRGHVVIARKHPAAAMSLPLVEHGQPGRIEYRLRRLRRRGMALAAAAAALPPMVGALGALRLRRSWSKALRLLHFCAYWSGVLHECGSAGAVRRLVSGLPAETLPPTHLVIDVASDLGGLADRLSARPVDAVTFRHNDREIGRIEYWPGAEALRPAHVRYALAHLHADSWWRAVTDSWWQAVIDSGAKIPPAVPFRAGRTIGWGDAV